MSNTTDQSGAAPVYNYDLDPLHPDNVAAAKRRRWTFDPDFHDHKDCFGNLVHGPWHVRPAGNLGPPR